MIFFFAPKSLTAINRCLDEMEEFNGRDTAISCRGHFPFRTVREIVAALFAFNLSDYRVKTILYVFPPLFIVKAVSVRLLEIINRHNNFKWS